MRSMILAVLLLAARAAAAWDGVLLLPDGRPAADSNVSISGVTGAALTDAQGRFVLHGERVPLTLIVVGPRGEIYPPVTVTEIPSGEPLTIRLEPVLSETMTVSSGVAPNIEAP